ncbi:MAG: hypothetical protein ACD_28C00244G0003 [uncultured bacterium]|nr:MAG: hypothetical protein ACD_28C00244G0003 [uncultured bacterium]KKT75970.1 MAG: hypothetical protein UW70_C0025G0018 [Candidatus Peregrinibacteria bacterium GW2011_GWA2_44_7]
MSTASPNTIAFQSKNFSSYLWYASIFFSIIAPYSERIKLKSEQFISARTLKAGLSTPHS